MKVLLGISGGIAAYKAPDLLRRFQKSGHQVAVALTPSAQRFVSTMVLRTLADGTVMEDIFTAGERVGHVALADWPDVMVVAPATAQTIARLATGMADEPVSLCFLATRARRIVFPAMNVNMWTNPATAENVARLRARGIEVVDPEAGELACGWEGAGRLPNLDAIVAVSTGAPPASSSLAGVRIVLTAGPTREFLDPVRYFSNPSSGKMGFALAERAAARGADVVLVSGPVTLATPPRVRRIDVVTAAEMRAAVFATLEERPADVLIAAAAVADYRPSRLSKQKVKKSAARRTLALERTPDVLAEAVERFAPPVRVGFAAETERIVDNAREKLERKDLTLIVANDVSAASGVFGADTNAVWVIERDRTVTEVPRASKLVVADRILDIVVRHLDSRA